MPEAVQLRVCHIIGALKYGGAERQFINTLNALSGVRRYALFTRRLACVPDLEAELDPDIVRYKLQLRQRTAPLAVLRMARWLRRQRIDVVHTHLFGANLSGALAARLAGVPIVVTTDHGLDRWKRAHHHWLERQVITPLVDHRFCVSQNVFESLTVTSGVAPEKLSLASNGTVVPPALEQRELAGGELHIGAVGRLVWEKDFSTLIQAVALLRDRGRRLRLSIVGDGPEKAALQRRIEELGLKQQVELLGFQSDVPAWLSRFDLFAISSVEEGQPLALLEAMARGLPVVATRIGGIPATLADGREGLLVEPRDPRALAKALETLSEDSSLRQKLGEAARQRIIDEFSVQALARRYLDTYAQLWEARCGGNSAAVAASSHEPRS